MFGLILLYATVSTFVLVTLRFQSNKHPPIATSPHSVGPSASSTNSSTRQKSYIALQSVTDGVKLTNSEKRVAHCHFVQHKFYIYGLGYCGSCAVMQMRTNECESLPLRYSFIVPSHIFTCLKFNTN